MQLPKLFRRKEASIPIFSRIASFAGGFFDSSVSTGVGRKQTNDLYTGWVFSCVSAIAQEVSTIELGLMKTNKNGDKEIVLDHPASNLLKKVNDYMDMSVLFERLQSNKELHGDEYWFLEPGVGGIPDEIFPLNPLAVKPIGAKFNYISHYEYTLNGKKFNIPPEFIIHFKTFNPKSDIKGVGTIEAVREAVETDDFSKEYNKSFFENSAQPGVILEVPGELKKEDSDRLKSQWNQELRGFKRNYRTAVAANGLKVTKLELSHADMEFINQRTFSRDEILAIFHVPKTIIGILEDVNFASAKTANYVFTLRTIMPKMNSIVGALNEFYLPLFKEEGLEFVLLNKIPEDRLELIAYYNAGINNGWLSHNEVRRMEGLPPIVDGDKVYLPFNVAPFSEVEDIPTSTRSIETPIRKMAKAVVKVIKENSIHGASAVADEEQDEEPEEPKNSMDEKEFEAIGLRKNEFQIKRAANFEKKFEEAAMELFKGQKKRAIANLKKELDKKSWKASKFNLLDEEKEIKTTIDLFTPLMTSLYKQEGQEALDFLGIDETFNVSKPSVKKAIEKNTRKFAGKMTQTTVDGLRAQIVAGIEQNESVDDLAKRISQFSGFKAARSEMIARSEVVRAQASTELAVWKESGIVVSKIWYTALDERVCPWCEPLHGEEVGLGQSFVSEDEMKEQGINNYDGTIKRPPLHPSCRCTLIPVINQKEYVPKEPTEAELLERYLALNND